jgi:hypothetical protein
MIYMATRYSKGRKQSGKVRNGKRRTGKRRTLRRGGDAAAASLFTQGAGGFGTSASALGKTVGINLPN